MMDSKFMQLQSPLWGGTPVSAIAHRLEFIRHLHEFGRFRNRQGADLFDDAIFQRKICIPHMLSFKPISNLALGSVGSSC
jgi:hypothetical protein